ncbi:MAG: methyltetrahydrofolate cobalamin methyltransferase, partial [Candidatus Aminicenantales bacterium]
TTCGLSNISYGLPQRRLLNACFLAMAIERGLDSAIANPLDRNLIEVARACDAVTGRDPGMKMFLQAFGRTFEP